MNASPTSTAAPTSRFRGCGTYAVAASVVLLALAAPVTAWSGEAGPVLAWLLTFVPGAIVMALATSFQDSRRAVSFVILSTILRMGVAAGGGFVVLRLLPALPRNPFLFWLATMYVLALAMEVYLILAVTGTWIALPASLSGSRPNSRAEEAVR